MDKKFQTFQEAELSQTSAYESEFLVINIRTIILIFSFCMKILKEIKMSFFKPSKARNAQIQLLKLFEKSFLSMTLKVQQKYSWYKVFL